MDLDAFINDKLNNDDRYLKNDDGEVLYLYHGTNRKFDQHSIDKNRTILNDNYQGDWICYSANEDVAWKYAHAARNQNFDKELFLKDLDNLLEKTEDNFKEHFKTLTLNLMELGFKDGWDKTFKRFAETENIKSDVASQEFFKRSFKFEKELGIDLNEFMDILEYVEYSRSAYDEDDMNFEMNFFDTNIEEIPEYVINEVKKLGFSECLVEPRVLKSIVKAENILKTDNRELAKTAKEKGFDLVIYSGEGAVDEEPEYLILNPEQISIESFDVEHKLLLKNENIFDDRIIHQITRKTFKNK